MLSFGELFAVFSEVAVLKAYLLWGAHTCVLLVVLVAGICSLPVSLSAVVAVEVLAAGRPLLSAWSCLLIQQLCSTFVLRRVGMGALLTCERVAL